MKSILAPIALGLSILWFSGCEQVIEIELPEHEPQLVVNCTFMPDSVFMAQVSVSKHLQDTAQMQSPEDATLIVYEDGLPFDTLVFTNLWYRTAYRGDRIPQVGKLYSLQASKPGFTTVEGHNRIPNPAVVANLTYEDSIPSMFEDQVWDEVTFSIQDEASTSDFYVVGIELRDSVEVTPGVWEEYAMTVGSVSDDPILERDINGNVFSFSDDTFNGNARSFRIRMLHDDIAYGNPHVVVLKVSEDYFRYLRSMSAYEETQFNPFAEPVIIHSNMTPQMGIFAGYARTSLEIVR